MPIAALTALIAEISNSVRAFAWLLAIMFAFAVFLGVAVILKRVLFSDKDDDSDEFTLVELRKLYDEGQLSHAEYESAKGAVIDRMRKREKTGKPRQR